jgi:polyisoprenoid-binding protein YceI
MKIIISIVAIALIIGLYILIQDQKIKKDLRDVTRAEFVEDTNSDEVLFASEIQLTRAGGVWSGGESEFFRVDASSLKFEFTGYKPGGLHVGTFQNMSSNIRVDEEGNPVSASFVFDIDSIKTDSEALDKHLQTNDFFNSEMYPQIVVEVKRIEQQASQTIAITDITMKGVTRTIAIPIIISENTENITFSIDTLVKISDFAIAYGPVQDEVRIVLEGSVLKK